MLSSKEFSKKSHYQMFFRKILYMIFQILKIFSKIYQTLTLKKKLYIYLKSQPNEVLFIIILIYTSINVVINYGCIKSYLLKF